MQDDLFAPDWSRHPKRSGSGARVLTLLITVKAAPNPSATHGETVCVAGVSIDPDAPGWLRLYPVNFRSLEADLRFQKYDVVTVPARPAQRDSRAESWNPDMARLQVIGHYAPWKRRRALLDPLIQPSMCHLNQAAQRALHAQSLGLIRVRAVEGMDIERHPGWSAEEQAKIDRYVAQLDLFGDESRSALEAPRFRGYYRWLCADADCQGHRQGMIDWEFVAFQRRLDLLDDAEAAATLRARFVDQLCSERNEVCFYVGNQAKRENTFSVLGVYYPRR